MERRANRDVARATARGVIAAMAMTGMRRMTTALGLVEETPPEAIAEQAPLIRSLLDRVPHDHRTELIEAAHWVYGGLGGAAFGLLVRSRRPWAGPVFGLSVWALFETGIAPVLGLDHAERKEVSSRLFVALDHVLYGTLVAGEAMHSSS